MTTQQPQNDEVTSQAGGRITLNIGEAAACLGVSCPTMRALVNRGDFPAFKIGSRWLISRTALDAWAIEQSRSRAELGGVRE